MAEVYVAKTKGIGGFEKLVALKLIHPRLAEGGEFVRMLIEEAKISVLLNHTNIAQTFDLGCIEDLYFIVMEFVDGVDAYRLMKRAESLSVQLPPELCAFVMMHVCNALDYAHHKTDSQGNNLGIVHRDVSPQNVLISYEGAVKLVDFGIAKAALRSAETDAGVIKGKYYYMSPEQARGTRTDHRSDIFSAGVVLYELLTRSMLYEAQNVAELLTAAREARVEPAQNRRADLPSALLDILDQALRKDPEQRFQRARDMSNRLGEYLHTISPPFNAHRLSAHLEQWFHPAPFDEAALVSQSRKQAVAPTADVMMRLSGEHTDSMAIMSRDEFEPDHSKSLVVADVAEFISQGHDGSLPHADTAPARALVGRKGDRHTRPVSIDGMSPAAEWTEDTGSIPVPQVPHASSPSWQEDTYTASDPQSWDESTEVEDVPDPGSHPHAPDSVAAPAQPDAYDSLTPHADQAFEANEAPPRDAGSDSTPDSTPDPTNDPEEYLETEGYHAYPMMEGESVPRVTMSRRSQPPASQERPSLLPGGRKSRRTIRSILAVLIVSGALVAVGVVSMQLYRRSQEEAVPQLRVISVPSGARVALDGRSQPGVTPLRIEQGLETDRMHELRVTLAGYQEWSVRFQPSPGLVEQVAVLKPRRATLTIRTVPKGAHVWVDGVPYGTEPVEIPGLPIGRELSVRAAQVGRQEVTRSLRIHIDDLSPEINLFLPEGP